MEFMFQYEETDNEQNLWVKKLDGYICFGEKCAGKGNKDSWSGRGLILNGETRKDLQQEGDILGKAWKWST